MGPGITTVEFQGKPFAGNSAANVGTAQYYCGMSCGDTGNDLKDPYASPYWATDRMLTDLPPLYFVASATELIGGDSMELANRAARLGVHVVLDSFYGMWHTFPQWSEGGCSPEAGDELWQGVAAISRMGQFVEEINHQSKVCPNEFTRSSGVASSSLYLLGDRKQDRSLKLSLCPSASS